MSIVHAFLLGLLQGATEFFPISSSAHLKIARALLGIENGEAQVFFDLVCHLGTLSALLFFLRKELLQIKKEQIKTILLALLPLPPAYFLLKPLRDFASETPLVGFFLIATSIILFVGGKIRILPKRPGRKGHAVAIGTMQSLALVPGISRSASTISCARVLGWSPQEAVRFSFLLAIPTIIGGNCLELLKIYLSNEPIVSLSSTSCIIGFCTALGMGLLVIGWGFRLLEKGCFKPFAWYCLILGTLVSVYFYG